METRNVYGDFKFQQSYTPLEVYNNYMADSVNKIYPQYGAAEQDTTIPHVAWSFTRDFPNYPERQLILHFLNIKTGKGEYPCSYIIDPL